MSDATALSLASAAAYLDMSVDTFTDKVRPFVPVVSIVTPDTKRPTLRWLKRDLDAYLEQRRTAA